ncbi:11124_t:CDS:1 [Paraglomus occultum]|uniref:11124_t:CDS:1 n=1 Tax=Paraglomus occultum TaxID=144539 RepID=A0A9N9BT86_9GLOM|nr:11124_t:CDS:1 [Paraglomus occultum]
MAPTNQYRTRLITTAEMAEITCALGDDIYVNFPVPIIQDIRKHIPNPRLSGSTQAIGGYLIFRIFFNEQVSQKHNTIVAEISALSSELWNSAEPNVRRTFNQLAEQTMLKFREEAPYIWPDNQ